MDLARGISRHRCARRGVARDLVGRRSAAATAASQAKAAHGAVAEHARAAFLAARRWHGIRWCGAGSDSLSLPALPQPRPRPVPRAIGKNSLDSCRLLGVGLLLLGLGRRSLRARKSAPLTPVHFVHGSCAAVGAGHQNSIVDCRVGIFFLGDVYRRRFYRDVTAPERTRLFARRNGYGRRNRLRGMVSSGRYPVADLRPLVRPRSVRPDFCLAELDSDHRHFAVVVDWPRQRGSRRHCGCLSTVDYLITNGFGAFPAMSIHTLFVCRYSRIASIPLSRPIPERL